MPIGIKYDGSFSDRSGLPRLTVPLEGFLKDWDFSAFTGAAPSTVLDSITDSPLSIVGGSPAIVDGFLTFDGVDDMANHVMAHFDQPFTLVLRGRLVAGSLNDRILVGSTAASQSLIGTDSTGHFRGYTAGKRWTRAEVADYDEHTFIFTQDGAGGGAFSLDGDEAATTSGVHSAASGVTGVLVGRASSSATFYNVAVKRLAIASHYADATERAAILENVGIPA
jgi:hypothetical protein